MKSMRVLLDTNVLIDYFGRRQPYFDDCLLLFYAEWGGEKRFIGEIVNTSVDEGIFDDEGRVDFGKMRPIVYDSTRRIYRVVGDVVGGAWEAGKLLL